MPIQDIIKDSTLSDEKKMEALEQALSSNEIKKADAFYLACQTGDARLFKWLNETVIKEPTLLLHIDETGYGWVHHAAEKNNVAVLKYLKEQGVNLSIFTKLGEYPIHLAVRNQCKESVAWLSQHTFISQINRAGHTPLLLAASYGYIDLVEILLQRKALLFEDTFKESPLKKAIVNGHLQVVALFYQYDEWMKQQYEALGTVAPSKTTVGLQLVAATFTSPKLSKKSDYLSIVDIIFTHDPSLQNMRGINANIFKELANQISSNLNLISAPVTAAFFDKMDYLNAITIRIIQNLSNENILANHIESIIPILVWLMVRVSQNACNSELPYLLLQAIEEKCTTSNTLDSIMFRITQGILKETRLNELTRPVDNLQQSAVVKPIIKSLPLFTAIPFIRRVFNKKLQSWHYNHLINKLVTFYFEQEYSNEVLFPMELAKVFFYFYHQTLVNFSDGTLNALSVYKNKQTLELFLDLFPQCYYDLLSKAQPSWRPSIVNYGTGINVPVTNDSPLLEKLKGKNKINEPFLAFGSPCNAPKQKIAAATYKNLAVVNQDDLTKLELLDDNGVILQIRVLNGFIQSSKLHNELSELMPLFMAAFVKLITIAQQKNILTQQIILIVASVLDGFKLQLSREQYELLRQCEVNWMTRNEKDENFDLAYLAANQIVRNTRHHIAVPSSFQEKAFYEINLVRSQALDKNPNSYVSKRLESICGFFKSFNVGSKSNKRALEDTNEPAKRARFSEGAS